MIRSALAIALIATPLAAQDAPARDPAERAAEALERLGRSALEALDELGALTGAWSEALAPVLADPDAYDPPETLPNGDVLIRRRPDAPAAPTPPEPENGVSL